MQRKTISPLLWVAIFVYWLFCTLFRRLGGQGPAAGLAWNLLLAALPLVFWQGARRFSPWPVRGVLLALWLLFLPNTFYMLTDLIHVPGPMEWVDESWQVHHNTDSMAWWLLLIIATGALIGAGLGLRALNDFYRAAHRYAGAPAAWGLVLCLCGLCGFGMYLGRFLRLNSWDVLHPLSLLQRFWGQFGSFGLQVWALFSGAIFLLFAFWRGASQPPE